MAGRSRIRTDLALEATERFQEENVGGKGCSDYRSTDHNGKRSQDHGKTTGNLYYH